MNKKKKTFLNSTFGRAIYFLLTWLFTGFALGTFILLILVRHWTRFVRKHDYSGSVESSGVIFLIILLIVLSLYITRKLYNWHTRKRIPVITFLALFIPLIFASFALFLFMNPALLNGTNQSRSVSARFTIGSYPTEDDMIELKRQNYTGVISLLHPAIVPFEPSLIRDEEIAAKNAGLQLIKAPMLPWVSDNLASLNKIQEIVLSGRGKYYIHCYLGKDRVNLVKNFILKLNNDPSILVNNASPQRSFEEMKRLERGDIYKLENQVYLTPFPTHEELLAFFLAGNIKTVVNFTDTSGKEYKLFNRQESEGFKNSGISLKYIPLAEKVTGIELSKLVDSIRTFPRPVVLHFWETRSPRNVQLRKMFYKKTGIAPVNLSTNVADHY